MKPLLGTAVVFILLFSAALGLLSSSCSKHGNVCRQNADCCGVAGHRIVCAPSLEICGKKICCVTEVEEQQERQAAVLRNRNPSPKRLLQMLLDEYEN
ncbi:unnamed protein product [Rotaria socialis]|uniref:Uncharacterized protein n=1 Tax=Rotaria socialis TaxID=392032 RepID=A0A819A7G8_9BILA|nr:unnamed protein product [Rotaria socialis]CAF3569154.1 unnamed protein product [Rotaria socialis]CAF3779684.1 unnamed protein product [Rotaria socialis]CAF4578342.1 unnamed protein product [Rotaria socialis]CAF4584857.1 unnamed protein product [Rotaria socialis]